MADYSTSRTVGAVSQRPRDAAWLGLRARLRDLAHSAERMLQPLRRSAATRALGGRGSIQSVVFICHGNVCRSPYAAAAFARAAAKCVPYPILIQSSGFIGPNRESPESAKSAAARRGLDLRPHRSALIDPGVLHSADLIVVMEARQAAALHRRFGRFAGAILVLGDLDPVSAPRRSIRDPWGCDDTIFDDSFARIDRCVHVLAQIVSTPARR